METLPLFPLNTVLLPGGTLPLHIFEPRYRLMIGRCIEEQEPFGVVLIRSGSEVGGGAQPFTVGTTARIVRHHRLDDGRMQIITLGERRFRIVKELHDQPYLTGLVEYLEDADGERPSVQAAAERTAALYREYDQIVQALTDQWTRRLSLPDRPGLLADHIAARIDLDIRSRQQLVEELSVARRLEMVERLLDNAVVLLRARLDSARRVKFGGFGVLN